MLKIDFMSYTNKNFEDPLKMFDIRTRQLRVRIQHLQADLVIAQHPFTKAVLKQEINKATDEYVARKIQSRTTQTDG